MDIEIDWDIGKSKNSKPHICGLRMLPKHFNMVLNAKKNEISRRRMATNKQFSVSSNPDVQRQFILTGLPAVRFTIS